MDYTLVSSYEHLFNYDNVVDNEKNYLDVVFLDLHKFDFIIDKLSKFTKIKFKITSNLELETIPESIFNLKNISELFLGSNKLKTIPYNIVKLNLNTLYIGSNKFYDFPINICKCKNLIYLDISNNNFKNFPIEICENLEFLDISNCNLTTIPHCINKLKKLEVLYLNGNKINNLNYNIKNIKNIMYNYKIYKCENKKIAYRLKVLITKNILKLNYKIINKLIFY